MNKKSQKQRILDALRRGDHLTMYDGYNMFGCTKLNSRISDLRAEGHPIRDEWIDSQGSRYKSYWIEEVDPNG